MAQKDKPAHKIQLGHIRVTIWGNKSHGERTWFNTTLIRLYKEGDQWKETSSLRRDDLPLAAKALDMAHDWIWKQEQPAEPVVVIE